MANYQGFVHDDVRADRGFFPVTLSATAYSGLPVPPDVPYVFAGGLAALGSPLVSTSIQHRTRLNLSKSYKAVVGADIHDEWFERIILFPVSLDLGNILSDQVINVEVTNNYRFIARTLTGVTDHTGGEVQLLTLPTLPLVMLPLRGLIVPVTVLLSGAPRIDGDITFEFDLEAAVLPITGTRITFYGWEPNGEVIEELEFLTDIIIKIKGTEQRIRKRNAPRQIISMEHIFDGDRERDKFNSLLYDWQPRVFGLPIRWEARYLTADVAAGASVVNVDTRYGDFRAGGLFVLYGGYSDYEVLQIESLTTTQLNLSSLVVTPRIATKTIVMPVRTGYSVSNLNSSRYPTGVTVPRIQFTVADNIDLSSTAAFPTFNGKPVLNIKNMVERTTREGFIREIEIMDFGLVRIQESPWDKSRPFIEFRAVLQSLESVWNFRQLLHALGGRQVGFYLGSGRKEIVPIANISAGATSIDIEAINFVTWYGAVPVPPMNTIQIVRTDGTVSQHQITSASTISSSVERLQFTPAVGLALPLSSLDRIEFMPLSRFNSDRVQFTHARPGLATISAETVGVPN